MPEGQILAVHITLRVITNSKKQKTRAKQIKNYKKFVIYKLKFVCILDTGICDLHRA